MKKQPPDKPTILTVVKQAQPVNSKGEIDRFADRIIDKLGIKDYRLVKVDHVKDKQTSAIAPITIPLFMNGAALIDYETVSDDGITENHYFVISGKTQDGRDLSPIKVSIEKFPAMAWVLQWGNRIVVAPGNGNKDNARAAIQLLSGDVPVIREYRHTGWRLIDGQYRYLSGTGAIDADDLDESIRVELDQGAMQRYRLPPPSEDRKHHAQSLLSLLNIAPNNPAVGAALLCAVCRAPLAEAMDIDFSVFISGLTGSFKSSVAALALGCFGDFVEIASAGRFPASFIDSSLDLTIKAHQAKDTVFVVDEYNPNCASQKHARELQDKAEFLFRATGNQNGRGTRNSDHSAREGRHPRGIVIATGEDMPKSPSLLGRMLVLEIKRGDVDRQDLTQFQANSKHGWHKAGLANYVAWLAPRMTELKTKFPEKVTKLIEQAHDEGFAKSHNRAAGIYASLLAGFDVFLDFLLESELIGELRAEALYQATAEALKTLIMAQAEYQEQGDEVKVFRSLLQSCFSSGRVHVGCHLSQGAPKIHEHLWGWRADEKDGDVKGRGELIGWINQADQKLWLEPESTFAAIQRLANSQGDSFLLTKSMLWKRLLERKILEEVENNHKTGKPRTTVKRHVNGKNPRVLVVSTKFIADSDDEKG